MPRNSQGLYTLPAGNPVVPNTLIEATWANQTMDDIAAALTASLPRDGSAPMTGPLTLASNTPTIPRHAASKGYVDQFLAYASGLPVGAVVAFGGGVAPGGFLLCDGSAVSRTTYATLFATVGTIYGNGDGSTTFNVPDLRSEFVRGRDSTRTLGSKQAASFASHTHAVSDPGHTHPLTDPGHTHTASQPAHSHGVSDPGHSHVISPVSNAGYSFDSGGSAAPAVWASGAMSTNGVATGIGIQTAQPAITNAPAVTGASAANNTTGATIGAAGGTETVPQNTALDYYIKAVNDASGPATITAITTSDPQMISVDNTLPQQPELVIHSNTAFGTVKLDASGQIPLQLLPSSSQQLLGYWDASGGQTPSQAFPANNYASGDTYIISVTGTLTVYDPVTLAASPTVVAVGSLLQYIENSLTNPTGWYYVVSSSTVVASQVGLTPVGSISATNVQAGFAEVDGDLTSLNATVGALGATVATLDGEVVKHSSATGAALIPAGTTAQQDTTDLGAFRYNTDNNTFEGYSNNGWGQVGGGQMYGTAPVKAIFYNAQSIAEDITVATGQNGLSAGPVTVDNGFAVTVANGSAWSVV